MPAWTTRRAEGFDPYDDDNDDLDGAYGERDASGEESRRRRMEPSAPEVPSTMLPLYLREMGRTPLIDEHEEVRLASQLKDARVALAKLALKLPASCRDFILEGDTKGPRLGATWPIDRIERFYGRLQSFATEYKQPKVMAIAREAKRHKARLDSARDALIRANLRLVVHIAKKYLNRGLPFMDLIQEGNIGLMRAVEKFEHERGNKFSTYAFWWIKQGVERAIADKSRVIRIPVHVNEKLKKVRRAVRALSDSLGRMPTPREVATELQFPLALVEEVLGIVKEPRSLEDRGPTGDDRDLTKTVPDEAAVSPHEDLSARQLRSKIEAVLSKLTPREEEIVRLRFGIGRDNAMTLEEIGRVMRLSRERVRQIESLALNKIQASSVSRDLRDLYGVV